MKLGIFIWLMDLLTGFKIKIPNNHLLGQLLKWYNGAIHQV
jgi:hypothetical protein